MNNSFRLGTIARIGIFVHWTFSILLAGVFLFLLYQGASPVGALAGVAVVLTVFGCVLLHELGHALMARRFGIPTLDITMYPIGGVARLQSIPAKPKQELLIAIAGPAVNLAIAGVLFLLNVMYGHPMALDVVFSSTNFILSQLMWINLGLAGFNMIPAFPMDGGRVLRAGLATQMQYRRATLIAAFLGQVMALLFGIYGLIQFNPVLIFIGVFVFLGARQEAEQAKWM